MSQWYYKSGGVERGPHTFAELGFLRHRGQLSPNDPVRKGNRGRWVPAGSVKGLFPAEVVTRSKMSPAELLALQELNDDGNSDRQRVTPSRAARAADEASQSEPIVRSHDTSAVVENAEPQVRPTRQDSGLWIAIGTSVAVGIILIILMCLLWPSSRGGGGGLAGTGSADKAAGQPDGSSDGDANSATDATSADEEVLEVEVSDEPPQPASSGKSVEPPQQESPGPSLLTVERLTSDSRPKTSSRSSRKALGSFTKRLEREGAQTGEIQISLIWNNRNDLDLQVLCPSGDLIYFQEKQSSDGGQLDVDMNSSDVSVSDKPVENVYWPAGTAPRGTFKIFVNHYYFRNKGGRDPTRFSIRVTVDGEARQFTGSISHGQPRKLVHSFKR